MIPLLNRTLSLDVALVFHVISEDVEIKNSPGTNSQILLDRVDYAHHHKDVTCYDVRSSE